MGRSLRKLICITGCILAILSEVRGQNKPIWKFSVLVAVEKQTADYYEKAYSKPIATIVREQLNTINAHFNSTDKFKGIFDFRADSIYIIEGSFQTDLFKPHPGFDYKVVIDGFAVSTTGGGWFGGTYQLIYHKWNWNEYGGPFQQTATDGLTHEFAHARGATDIYAMKVDASKNLVDGKAFDAINSIMNYPYGNITWDEYTVNLLNSTAGSMIVGEDYITKAFPKNINVKVKDAWGNQVKSASVNLHPVSWYTYTVPAKPIYNYITNEQGLVHFDINPFNPGFLNAPWHIEYPNFLIKTSYGAATTNTWFPIYEVQNQFFKYGADSSFTLNINLPAAPASLKIYSTNDSLFCVGETLTAYSYNYGSFGQINEFSLQLSDNTGSFLSPRVLYKGNPLKFPGDYPLITSGLIPNLPEGTYKIRIASSQPEVFSNEIAIKIQATPAPPLVTDLIICQNGVAAPLTAIGQNLRWYSSSTVGIGSLSPPLVSTTQAGDTAFYVSQSIGKCESPRAALKVKVQALPTLSVIGNSSIYIGEEASLNLKFTGKPPYQYRLSNGLSGTATKDTTLKVSPKSTTNYTVEEVSNSCGKGQAGSSTSATIIVQTPLLETLAFSPGSYCPGSNLKVGYKITGRFASGTSFKVQIATVGMSPVTYVDIPVVSNGTNEIVGMIPTATTPGNYQLRVVATHPSFVINGSVSPTSFMVLSPPTATLTGGEQIFSRDTAQLSVAFTGQTPWTFAYRAISDNSVGTEYTITTADNPYLLRVTPLISTAYYLTSVQNACGNGAFTTDGIIIKVVPLLNTSDPLTENLVEVYPIPTHSTIILRINEGVFQKNVRYELYNLLGQRVMQKEVKDRESVLTLENQPAGVYLLQIQIGDQVVVRRVMKQ